ncbi:MAG: VanZ family protein [Brasilonema sp.]
MILVIFSILVVLVATLYPFNFSFPDSLSLQLIIASFDNTSSFGDLVNNILLFMPLGFGFTALLQRKMMKLMSKLLIVILISAGLSSIVEILQVFLPSRTPTPADIVNNTIGGLVGIICFYLWHSQNFIHVFSRVENSRASNSVKKIRFLLPSGILLPSLIVEMILVIDTGKSISFKNILLGMFFTGGTMLILRLRASALLKKQP